MSEAVPTPVEGAAPSPAPPAATPSTPATPPATVAVDELRAVAASAAGLKPELASRLAGSTLTELVADAQQLAQLTAPAEPAPTPAAPAAVPVDPTASADGGTIREQPNGWTRESVAALAKQPGGRARLNALLERGEINRSQLR
jgi:hypothetical protein